MSAYGKGMPVGLRKCAVDPLAQYDPVITGGYIRLHSAFEECEFLSEDWSASASNAPGHALYLIRSLLR